MITLVYGTLLAATYEPVFEITYFSLVADYFLIVIFFTGSVGLFLRKRWGVFWLVYGSVWRLMEGAFFVYFMMILYEDVPFYAAALGILGSLIPFYGWPLFLLVWFVTHKLETKTSATLLAEKIFHDFENRTRYPQLTREVLESIGERDFQSAVVDYVSLSLEEEDDSEIEIVSEMSPGIQAIYTNWKVSADVRNGGFHQFFFN
ncbi:MAG: hypothetical protein KC917_23335, partial [Candidatus Omnitrophica bacterium]|nr:hypothetical protein [Candidatus Omnitrophota bacterium]